jgi:putative membrane protein
LIKGIVIRLLVGVAALWITSILAQQLGLPLVIGSASGAVLAVIALSFVNAVIRPVVSFFAMPLRCMTFGLIGIVINALLFLLVGQLGIEGFRVGAPGQPLQTLLAALFGSVVMGIVSALLNAFVRPRR